MASDTWIEIHTRLKEHTKTYALMDALKIKKPMAVGLLVCLWLWAIDNAENGDLTKYPDQAIARAAEWDKKPQTLIKSLIECGWIDCKEDGKKVLHDWMDYAGRLANKRQQSRDRAEKSRNNKRTVRAPCAQQERDATAPCAPTVPYRTVPTKLSVNRQHAVSTVEGDVTPPPPLFPGLIDVLKRWETEFSGFPSPALQDKLKASLSAGMGTDVICAAIDETALAGAQSPARYVIGVLQSWYAAGVRDWKSLEAHKVREQSKHGKTAKGGRGEYTIGEDGIKRDSAGFAVL